MTEKLKKSFEGQAIKTLSKMDLMRLPKRGQNIDPSLFKI